MARRNINYVISTRIKLLTSIEECYKMNLKILFIFSFLPLMLFGQYQKVGTDSTVDVLAWNIEWFAKDGQNTIDEVAQIVTDLDGDLFGVEEIASVDDFNQLLSQLSGWDGILSPHTYNDGSYQKVGLLYNTSEVTVHSWQLLFENDGYAFPRPPMEFTITVMEGSHSFDFKLIVVHLKAYGDEDSEQRRRAAIDSLKNYIDGQLALGGEQDFILLGDFNDHLEDPPEDNVFQVMLDDTAAYTFLTEPLAGVQGSYIGYNEPNLIDHICITNDALNEYGAAGNTEVLYLDDQNSSYESTVSDHRPVLAQFAFGNSSTTEYTAIADIHSSFSQYQGQVVTIKGVVTIGAGIFSNTYTSVYVQDDSDAGLNIYLSSAVLSDMNQGQLVEVTGEVAEYNGLHELKYHSHSVLADNQPLPEALTIETNLLNDKDAEPGRWTKVEGVIESISEGPHINMMVNDGSGAGKIYFDPDAGLDVSDFSVGETIRVTGVKTVYNNEGQLQPGYQDDIEKQGTSIINGSGNQPEGFQLFQNYPNPFNPTTAITYHLPAVSEVQLVVYNALGQEIRTLVSGRQKAGTHSVNFEAQGLASGIYIYQLKSDAKYVLTRKMLLLR